MSDSNLICDATFLMTKNGANIDTEVEFSWMSDFHPQNQTKSKLGYFVWKQTLLLLLKHQNVFCDIYRMFFGLRF